MKVKNETLFKLERLINVFDQVASRSKATGLVKLKYALARNKNKIKEPLEAIREATTPGEDFREYERALGKIAEEYSEILTDDRGREKKKPPKRLPDGRIQYFIDDSRQEEYDKEVENLRNLDEHKEAIERQEAREEEFQKLLKEESEVSFFKFNLSLIPDDVELFTVDDLEILYDLKIIKEDVDVNASPSKSEKSKKEDSSK